MMKKSTRYFAELRFVEDVIEEDEGTFGIHDIIGSNAYPKRSLFWWNIDRAFLEFSNEKTKNVRCS